MAPPLRPRKGKQKSAAVHKARRRSSRQTLARQFAGPAELFDYKYFNIFSKFNKSQNRDSNIYFTHKLLPQISSKRYLGEAWEEGAPQSNSQRDDMRALGLAVPFYFRTCVLYCQVSLTVCVTRQPCQKTTRHAGLPGRTLTLARPQPKAGRVDAVLGALVLLVTPPTLYMCWLIYPNHVQHLD